MKTGCDTSARNKGHLSDRIKAMLWTILAVLCILWVLGMVTSYTLGGFIHLLLVVAVVLFVFNLITGRRRSV